MTEAPASFPRGILYIIGNEAAERFSYYGMKGILVVFMTTQLMGAGGVLAPMSEADATTWYHLFSMTNYLCPIFGALLSDIAWGKYRTIMVLSVVYCFGHLALALDHTRVGLLIGLGLIALGSGGIKPCVAAHVGDQFTARTAALLPRMFSYFYLAINIGAFVSSLLTPWLLEVYGPHIAFGVPGILMLIATIVFWMGRRKFIAIPPVGFDAYRRALFSGDGKRALGKLTVLFLFVAFFWALYDQTGSTWVLQAQHLDRRIPLGFFTWEVLPAQLQALNPILIVILAPIFTHWIYPSKRWRDRLTARVKVFWGLLLCAVSFLVISYAQYRVDSGAVVSVGFQIAAYFIITVSEVLVSITALEFAYTQAPHALKSFLSSFFLLAVSLGNGLTALINIGIERLFGVQETISGGYFLGFSALMAVAAGLFLVSTRGLREELHLHG